MKLEISVPEDVEMFKEIQECPEKIFEMIRVDMRETVGQYLTQLMRAELTTFLDRQPYERSQDETNHRNGTYKRSFALKGIGQVNVGEVLEIWSGDAGTKNDMPRWCAKVGHEFLGCVASDGYDRLFIRRSK